MAVRRTPHNLVHQASESVAPPCSPLTSRPASQCIQHHLSRCDQTWCDQPLMILQRDRPTHHYHPVVHQPLDAPPERCQKHVVRRIVLVMPPICSCWSQYVLHTLGMDVPFKVRFVPNRNVQHSTLHLIIYTEEWISTPIFCRFILSR